MRLVLRELGRPPPLLPSAALVQDTFHGARVKVPGEGQQEEKTLPAVAWSRFPKLPRNPWRWDVVKGSSS